MAKIDQEDQTLKAKQEKAITALLSESSIVAAAQKIGIGERTLRTWLSDPVFKQAYQEARRTSICQAMGSLQSATSEAAQVIRDIMNDPNERGTTRLMAAKTIIDNSLKSLELEDLAQRVEELEQRLLRKPL